MPLALLSFDYGGEIVPAGAPDEMVQRLADGELVLSPRDRKAEDDAFKRLEKLDLREVKNTPPEAPKEHEGIEAAIEILKSSKAAPAEALFAGVSKTGPDLTEADLRALRAMDSSPVREAA